MATPPLGFIRGIPVRIDPWFPLGALIIFMLSGGGTAGLYTIVAMAVFVLIHELGHAFAARSFGSNPEITLTFLGGYTAYESDRRLTPLRRAAIGVAGAAAQLAVAVPLLWLVMHWVSREARASLAFGFDSSQLAHAIDLHAAVSWAGVLLALLNLIPALPLDGGMIVESLLRPVLGDRTPEFMRRWSLGVAAAMMAAWFWAQSDGGIDPPRWTPAALLNPSFSDLLEREAKMFASFVLGGSVLIPAFIFLAMASAGRRRPAAAHPDAAAPLRTVDRRELLRLATEAERRGWASGIINPFPPGTEPSPWLIAYAAERRGDARTAFEALYALDDSRPRRWVPPTDPSHPAIVAALARLPEQVRWSRAVLEARVWAGPVDALAACATERYARTGETEVLYLAAAGFARRGMVPDAIAWAERAVEREPRVDLLETLPPFGALRGTPAFEALVQRARIASEA